MADVKSLLAQVKKYQQEQGKEKALDALNSPASDKEIKILEGRLPKPMRLDKQYVDFLKVHNGAKDGFALLAWRPLSISEVLHHWTSLNKSHSKDDQDAEIDADSGIQSVWWDVNWVPVFRNPSGDYLCLDFHPDSGGKIGQVVWYSHDEGSRSKFASSFGDALDKLVHQHMDLYEEYKKRKAEQDKGDKKDSPSWLQWIKSKT